MKHLTSKSKETSSENIVSLMKLLFKSTQSKETCLKTLFI